MDCKTARMMLAPGVPRGELDAGETLALKGHLADCPDCAAAFRDDQQWDAELARAMRAVPVPAGPRADLLSHLDAAHRRRVRRKLAEVGSLAAALLIATFAVAAWVRGPKPTIDPQEMVYRAELFNDPPAVERYFRERGYPVTLPGPFDFQHLHSYTVAELKGRMVPQLEFQRGEATAIVYVLRPGQFHIAGDINQPAIGSRIKVHILQRDEWVYVVRVSGGDIEQFLAGEAVAAAV